jgi:hypothetical protein
MCLSTSEGALCNPLKRAFKVASKQQAAALVAAAKCEGGTIDVMWSGKVVLNETIVVGEGTTLIVKGGANSIIDGNNTMRLFEVCSSRAARHDSAEWLC